jgi:Ca-activated chloride channel family protein
MKRVRYTKYNGDLASEMELDDLLKSLSDYLLDSGFQDPFSRFSELQGDQTMDNLREAIRQALEAGDLDEQMQQKLDEMSSEQMEQLIEQLIQRMEQENYISIDQPHDPSRMATTPGNVGQQTEGETRFEVTDKSMDFLGYRTLRDLLGSLGKSSFGRHDTLNLATGIESSGASKPYEFGDTLNFDSVATFFAGVKRSSP